VERGRDGVPLWCRQLLVSIEQARAQLMEAGVGKLHLPLSSDRVKDATLLGAVGGVLEQG
jgi:hypothetical protein